MISWRSCGGDLLSTLCTERSSVDHTSSTKQKITLVEGRSSWIRLCAQLDEGDKTGNRSAQSWQVWSGVQDSAHVSGLVSGMERSTGIWSLR